ncbi:DegV family protein [Mycoplasmopsis ciconiae]|uniref:DegV family protein n=1 Tax=Mycoplasmopsis ciconiae TaxID=561067 RepID=A0ABU7MMF0_9BACT|nr:DegV family protein [Mycoplasmopsis ciconiae]
MKKLGIIIDSFSQISKEEANKMGYGFLSLQSEIDNKVFVDGVDDPIQTLEALSVASKYLTSLPRLDLMEQEIEKFAKNYDDVIVLLINQKLSSSAQYAQTIAKNYNNVYVVDNSFVGTQFLDVAKISLDLYSKNYSVDEVIDNIHKLDDLTINYIVPKNLDYIIGGGRLSAAKKFIMTKIQMIPILKYKAEVSVSGLKRSTKSAIEKVFEKLIKFIGGAENIDKFSFRWIHGIDQVMNQQVLEIAKNFNITLENEQITATAVAIHCGPGAISLSVFPKVN